MMSYLILYMKNKFNPQQSTSQIIFFLNGKYQYQPQYHDLDCVLIYYPF
jgi:hypothetical protein